MSERLGLRLASEDVAWIRRVADQASQGDGAYRPRMDIEPSDVVAWLISLADVEYDFDASASAAACRKWYVRHIRVRDELEHLT